MEHDKNGQYQKNDVFSKRIRAGKRRTYFFDVRTTKANDYYLTITESKKRFDDNGYDRHKVFIYKEDFNKFIHTLEEMIDHVKNNLMPDYDFDTYDREAEDVTDDHNQQDHKSMTSPAQQDSRESLQKVAAEESSTPQAGSNSDDDVMSWD